MYQRRSIRLKNYDYSQCGAYFVTICTHNRICLFGHIDSGDMHVNSWGEIAQVEWQQTAVLRPKISLDTFVVMPNHIHGILVFDSPEDTARRVPTPRQFSQPIAGSLSTIVGSYKSAVTKRINHLREDRTPLWQKRFYNHIIRNEEDLNRICAYIENNPARWKEDLLYV